MFNFLLLRMYSDRRGNRQNPPDKSPREQLREVLYRGFCPGFVLLKMGGQICVTYFMGEGPELWTAPIVGAVKNSSRSTCGRSTTHTYVHMIHSVEIKRKRARKRGNVKVCKNRVENFIICGQRLRGRP